MHDEPPFRRGLVHVLRSVRRWDGRAVEAVACRATYEGPTPSPTSGSPGEFSPVLAGASAYPHPMSRILDLLDHEMSPGQRVLAGAAIVMFGLGLILIFG